MTKKIKIFSLLLGIYFVGFYILYNYKSLGDQIKMSYSVIPLGVIFIFFVILWYRDDIKNEREEGISENFRTYIKSIGKVGLLMFGLLFLLFPVFNFIVLSDSEIADSIQMFNGVAAIILGLAIAGAGAWVSIKLAYVATEIASNHYYSEESKKRYDEASEAAGLMREVDLCLSRIFNKINIFISVSEKLSKNKTHNVDNNHVRCFINNLKYIAEEGAILGELYQKALNTPTLLEIIESEAIFASFNNDENRGVLPEDIQKHLMHLTLSMKVLNINDEKDRIKAKSEGKTSESEEEISRRIYQTMQFYSDAIITNSLDIIDRTDSMTEHEIIKYCNVVEDIIETIKSSVKKSREEKEITEPKTFDELYERSLIAFTLLDYMFTCTHEHDGVEYKTNRFENNTKIDGKSSEEKSRQGNAKLKSYPKTNLGTNNVRVHELDASSTLVRKEKKTDDVDKEMTDFQNQPDTITFRLKKIIKPENDTQESSILTSKNNKYINANDGQNYVNSPERKLLLSPSKFPAIMNLLPRVPRGGLSALDKREDQHEVDFINTIYKGVHILRDGKASMNSEASRKHSKNLQVYIYRTLAVSNHLSDRLIEPLTLHKIDPFKGLAIHHVS